MYAAFQTVLILCCLSFPTQQGGGKSDLDLLQGTWKTTSLIVNGKEVPSEKYQDERITVSGNQRILKKGDKQVAKATIALDPATNPKSVDFISTDGEFKGVALKGIYKFEGDTLILNLDLGQERPKDFTCPINSSRTLQKFQRVAER